MTAPRLSDRRLRTGAWTLWWFLAAIFAVEVVLFVAGPTATAGSDGGGAVVADLAFGVVVLTFPLTGLLILRRHPRNTIGWLLHGIGLAWGLGALAENYALYGLLVHPGSLPGPDVAAAFSEGHWAPGIGLMGTFLILLYPDGHLPSPRWRPLAWLSAVTIVIVTLSIDLAPGRLAEGPFAGLVNPIGVESAGRLLDVLLALFLPLLPLCIIACATALVLRFRHAHGVERLQLRWLATAGGAVALVYVLAMVSGFSGKGWTFDGQDPDWLVALQTTSILSFVLLPLAIGVAMLRHRLYDIDLVIKRTLVYGALTATLVASYLALVLLLQVALSPVTSDSDLAVAGSTLAVAALFRPLRSRIQSTVNRRFFRARYDAARTLEAFAVRLRDELDLESLGTDLRLVVTETMQPAHVSLWLRSTP